MFNRLTEATLCCMLVVTPVAWSQAADVSLRIELSHEHEQRHSGQAQSNDVVVWLEPLQNGSARPLRSQQGYVLTQKNKQFQPHLLVVPTGSSVDFPNTDPFFHNVFSLFNGKRFDLGLYEAHTHRAVQFDREGVSYIFCNIHPEMGAVIVALSTPYYGVSGADGLVVIHGVAAGKYRLHVWAENVPTEGLAAVSKVVEIDAEHGQLGVVHLQTSGDVMSHHRNKFGESYSPEHKEPY